MLKFQHYDIITMTSVQVSEFYLVYKKVLSLATPVQNFTVIRPFITELLVFFMFFVCVFLDKR